MQCGRLPNVPLTIPTGPTRNLGFAVLGAGLGGAALLFRLAQPGHALLVASLALGGGPILLLMAFTGRAMHSALHFPLLRARGLAPKDDDPLVTAVHAEAETALEVAGMLRSGGQAALATQMDGSAVELLRSARSVQERRARMRLLPGARSAEAAWRCAEALETIAAAIGSLRVHLGEAGAAEEWGAASVEDALASARAAAADASAVAEVAFVGMAPSPLRRAS